VQQHQQGIVEEDSDEDEAETVARKAIERKKEEVKKAHVDYMESRLQYEKQIHGGPNFWEATYGQGSAQAEFINRPLVEGESMKQARARVHSRAHGS
jgi:hypothetical protein